MLVIHILKQYSITQPEIVPKLVAMFRGHVLTSRDHRPDEARRWRAKRRN